MPSVRIQPGHGGMNSESSPDYVSPSQAVSLENLLPRPGKVVLRGPISSDIDLGFAAPLPYSYLTGAMILGSNLVVRVGVSGANPALSYEIPSGVPGVGSSTVPWVGARFCALGSFAYSTPLDGTPNVLQWDGSGAHTSLANGPSTVADVTVHLARLFTITRSDSSLHWSDQGGPLTDLASYWQDDVSGLTNQIVVGDANDLSRGLAHVGKQLAILKDRSIWLLTGLTPSSFGLQRMTSEWGCVARETIVDHDDGCFFLSERGFAYFDGSTVTDVSEDIKAELLTAMRDAPIPFGGVATKRNPSVVLSFARAASIGRDCVMLVIGRDNTDSTVVSTIYFCGIYDTRQRTWTKFSSDAFVAGAPTYLIPTPPSSYYDGSTLGYDGAGNLIYMDDIVASESATATLAGEDTVDGTTAAIPAEFHSRIVPLSSPTKTSQLKRLLFDYSFVVVSDADPTIDAWSVSLVDGQGNVLLAPTAVQATILASGYTADQRQAALVRKRFQVECFAEASEVQLRVTLPTLDADVTQVIVAEIHDATIEHEPGRDRPTS